MSTPLLLVRARDLTPIRRPAVPWGTTLVALAALAGCHPSDGDDKGDDDSHLVFEAKHLQRFELEVLPEDLERLREDALEEDFVPAGLAVDGVEFGRVGIRYKGSYSLAQCFESGEQDCPKVSVKLKFNEYDPDQRFHGLRRLAFDAPYLDASLLRERLANSIYRDLGVVVPRVNHALVTINGESQGLFSVVEQADGTFTDHHFPGNGDGNLYKEAWPGTDTEEIFARQLKTNEETGTHEAVMRFAEALQSASDAELPGVVSRWMDVDALLVILAIDEAVHNWDGITTFYYRPELGTGHNHNYYLYQEEDRERFWLIPWDLDQTLEVLDRVPQIPSWSELDVDCSEDIPIHGGTQTARAPACDPLLRGLALLDRERYLSKVQEVLDGPFQLDGMNAKLDAWAAQIADAVAADSLGPGAEGWAIALDQLRSDLGLLRRQLEMHRDGVEPGSFGLALDETNDFEGIEPLSLAQGVTSLVSSRSELVVGLNQNEPLGDATDLRIDFELRNVSDDPAQSDWVWTMVQLGFANHVADLVTGGISRLRLQARADANRGVRVDLQSPECHRFNEGVCFGWEFVLGVEPQSYDLELSEAALPSWVENEGEDLEGALGSVSSLNFRVQGVGIDASGMYPIGTTDPGFVQIDDIEFLP